MVYQQQYLPSHVRVVPGTLTVAKDWVIEWQAILKKPQPNTDEEMTIPLSTTLSQWQRLAGHDKDGFVSSTRQSRQRFRTSRQQLIDPSLLYCGSRQHLSVGLAGFVKVVHRPSGTPRDVTWTLNSGTVHPYLGHRLAPWTCASEGQWLRFPFFLLPSLPCVFSHLPSSLPPPFGRSRSSRWWSDASAMAGIS